jgi:hypothetical protein
MKAFIQKTSGSSLWEKRPSQMGSRHPKSRNPSTETVAILLTKMLKWIRSQ